MVKYIKSFMLRFYLYLNYFLEINTELLAHFKSWNSACVCDVYMRVYKVYCFTNL